MYYIAKCNNYQHTRHLLVLSVQQGAFRRHDRWRAIEMGLHRDNLISCAALAKETSSLQGIDA
jgi:hypothetical protein